MPEDSDKRISEVMEILSNSISDSGKIGLVTFGAEAMIESQPSKATFSGFSSDLDKSASNLDEALKKAIAMIPTSSSGRIVVLSDGKWTGVDPEKTAFKAAKRGIPIDYRFLSRNHFKDLAITSFDVPGQVEPGESFLVSASIYSPGDREVELTFSDSKRILSKRKINLIKGENYISFQNTAAENGVQKLELSVSSSVKDPVPENNRAFALTEISGIKPILILSEKEKPALLKLLMGAGIKTVAKMPHEISWNLETLAGYSAVVIENVSANRVTQHGMRVLAAWVKHLGGGLFLSGGKNSFGPGGYYQSPIEEVLPVTMELRNEHRKLSLAIVIVLDRSGSMAAPTAGARTKMDLANIGAASSLDLLSPMDEFGCLAVDSEAHVICNLEPIGQNKQAIRGEVISIESSGGGIYVFEGISKAAEMLSRAAAKTRHMVLFADASDAEQPGRYWELLEKCSNVGITCSVIGLGTEHDSDAGLLKKIAKHGNGRIFFTRDPAELPRLFTQDTFVAAKSSFIEEKISINGTNGLNNLIGYSQNISGYIDGYNLCYLRPEALLGVKTGGENNAPIIAAWQCGLGRVAAYMGELDGKFSGDFVKSSEAASVFTALSNWLRADKRQELDQMLVTQKVVRGQWEATLHLDPEREKEPFKSTPQIIVLRSISSKAPEKFVQNLTWKTADSLGVESLLTSDETIISAIKFEDGRKIRLSPIRLPYSQEYALSEPGTGEEKLKEISEVTSGIEIVDLHSVWDNLPRVLQFRDLTNLFIYMALLMFFVEILERRMNIASSLFPKRKGAVNKSENQVLRAVKSEGKPGSGLKTFDDDNNREQEEVKDAFIGGSAQKESFSSALKRARKSAEKRTRKK